MSGSSSSPTIPGVGGSTLSLSFVGSANVGLAQQIANALAMAVTDSTIEVVNYTGASTIPAAPSGFTEELVLSSTVSGSITVPAATSGASEILVLQNTQAITIHGSPGLQIIGGGPGSFAIIDPNIIAIGASVGASGSAAITVTSADSPYEVGMGPGFESVTGQGAGTISGGVGTNFIDVRAETGENFVNLVGSGDTVLAGTTSGVATSVNAAGYQALVNGEAGPLIVTDQGYLDTISAGAATSAAVTTSGLKSSVIGGTGTLSVIDTGLRDAIQAGSNSTTVTLDGSLGKARGGTGNLSVLDQTASNTVIGAAAGLTSVTIGASASNTDMFGRPGNLNVLDLGANALIGSGEGTAAITVDGAGSQVYGGGGNLDVSIGAANAIVAGLAANTTVDASSSLASGALIFGGFENTASLDGSLSVLGGADQLLVITGGSNSTINAATAAGAFTGVYIGTGSIAGNNIINGSASALQVNFIGGAGSATVFAGAGAATLFGADGANADFIGSTVAGAPGGFLYANGTAGGTETLNAGSSTTNDTLFGALGNVSLVAGSGSDVMFGGANTGSLGGAGTVTGGDTLAGGSGADQMIFSHGAFEGGAVITGFTSADSVLLLSYNASAGGNEAAIALANATTVAGAGGTDTTITLSDNTHITFVDATVQQLQGHISST